MVDCSEGFWWINKKGCTMLYVKTYELMNMAVSELFWILPAPHPTSPTSSLTAHFEALSSYEPPPVLRLLTYYLCMSFASTCAKSRVELSCSLFDLEFRDTLLKQVTADVAVFLWTLQLHLCSRTVEHPSIKAASGLCSATET